MSIRCLVVDDDQDCANSMVRVLNLLGYAARGSYSAAEALSVARQFKPHVALIDIVMPYLDGFALVGLLGRESCFRTVGLIALTGLASKGDEKEALARGFDFHLRKPASSQEVVATIRRASLLR